MAVITIIGFVPENMPAQWKLICPILSLNLSQMESDLLASESRCEQEELGLTSIPVRHPCPIKRHRICPIPLPGTEWQTEENRVRGSGSLSGVRRLPHDDGNVSPWTTWMADISLLGTGLLLNTFVCGGQASGKKGLRPCTVAPDGPIAGYSSIQSPARERFIRRAGCHAMLVIAT
ncbi:hypothetical protein M747DRAFT_300798 [Aspergillus niger ATCC 13496]|uniref:Uncharacterized protein n=1 Tax=Aspergillus niger ATCC 13496 TaxID=1353008 RepID=A0A370CDP9_ASPNG|nr:hypothetical protein M747DRAFT_300798 [Aspergillus niger ATCC 13496]